MARTNGMYRVFLSLRAVIARSVMGIVPPKEVEDIVQETYVRACQVERKTTINTPRSFLLKTARNLALDHVKRAESRLAVSLGDDEPSALDTIAGRDVRADETFEDVASNEEFALFCEAVRHLPVQCRRAFVLKKVYGYSRREIAQLMGLTENTVQTQIARGMKRCTYFMEQFEKDGSLRNARVRRSQPGATCRKDEEESG